MVSSPLLASVRQLAGSGRFQNAPQHCRTLVRRRRRGNRRRGSGSNGWLRFHGGTRRCGWNHRRAAAGTRLSWRAGHRCTNHRAASNRPTNSGHKGHIHHTHSSHNRHNNHRSSSKRNSRSPSNTCRRSAPTTRCWPGQTAMVNAPIHSRGHRTSKPGCLHTIGRRLGRRCRQSPQAPPSKQKTDSNRDGSYLLLPSRGYREAHLTTPQIGTARIAHKSGRVDTTSGTICQAGGRAVLGSLHNDIGAGAADTESFRNCLSNVTCVSPCRTSVPRGNFADLWHVD